MSDLKTAAPGCFPTTQWTLILDVIQRPDNDDAAWAALGEFCERYRHAVYNFFRRRGCSHADADEYTQEFFLTRVHRRWDVRKGFLFKARRREQGKFRCFLAQVLHWFLIDKWRGKRPEDVPAEFPEGREPAEAEPPAFGRELDRELALEIIQTAAGNSTRSKFLLAHFRGEISQADAATALGMKENAFKQAYARFRQNFTRNLRKEIGRLLANPDPQEMEAEIKYLMSLF